MTKKTLCFTTRLHNRKCDSNCEENEDFGHRIPAEIYEWNEGDCSLVA